MDFNQRDYFFQMQQLRQMPYPLMYPYPDLYMSEMETERDLQYLQQMYPADAKRMQKKVEEELDKLEYEGSMMYDEYPDRLQLRLMCRRIYDKAEKEEENPGAWLMDLIEVMTYQELCRRRVEHREIRKKIYCSTRGHLEKNFHFALLCVILCGDK